MKSRRALPEAESSGLVRPMRSWLKRVLFGAAPRRARILAGAGRGLLLTIDHSSNLQRRFGLAEREVEADFVRLAQKAASLADFGASDGYYGLLAHRSQPGLCVRAFEPLEGNARTARADWRANGFPPEALDWRREEVGPPHLPLAAALDGLPAPVLVKIDIEGVESVLLAEATEFLSTFDGSFLVETHAQAIESLCGKVLDAAGFNVRILNRAAWRRWLPERRVLRENRWLVAER